MQRSGKVFSRLEAPKLLRCEGLGDVAGHRDAFLSTGFEGGEGAGNVGPCDGFKEGLAGVMLGGENAGEGVARADGVDGGDGVNGDGLAGALGEGLSWLVAACDDEGVDFFLGEGGGPGGGLRLEGVGGEVEEGFGFGLIDDEEVDFAGAPREIGVDGGGVEDDGDAGFVGDFNGGDGGFEGDFELDEQGAGDGDAGALVADGGGGELAVGAWIDDDLVFGVFAGDGDEGGACAGSPGGFHGADGDAFAAELIHVGAALGVIPDAADHGDAGALAGGCEGLIGAFAAEATGELGGDHGFTGAGQSLDVGKDVDVQRADDGDDGVGGSTHGWGVRVVVVGDSSRAGRSGRGWRGDASGGSGNGGIVVGSEL